MITPHTVSNSIIQYGTTPLSAVTLGFKQAFDFVPAGSLACLQTSAASELHWSSTPTPEYKL